MIDIPEHRLGLLAESLWMTFRDRLEDLEADPEIPNVDRVLNIRFKSGEAFVVAWPFASSTYKLTKLPVGGSPEETLYDFFDVVHRLEELVK